MPSSCRVTNLEKKLGFKWDKGLSRTKGESCKIRIVKHLIEDIDELKQRWVHVTPRELRRDNEFEDQCIELYKKHADQIWPPFPADRSAWLVDAAVNNWNGMYPRDLSVAEHDPKLKNHFVNLIFEKCVRYQENQKQLERRALKTYTNSNDSEIVSPSAELDEDDNIDLGPHNTSSGRLSGSGRAKPTCTQNSFATSSDTSATKVHSGSTAAPVAQMLPRDYGTSRAGERVFGTRQKERYIHHAGSRNARDLNHADSDDMDTAANGPSLRSSPSWSPIVEQSERAEEDNNSSDDEARPRKRLKLNFSKLKSPAKGGKKQLATRVQNTTDKAKDTPQTHGGSISEQEAEPSTSTARLKSRMATTSRSFPTKAMSPYRSIEPSVPGSAAPLFKHIDLSGSMFRGNKNRKFTPSERDGQLRPSAGNGEDASPESSTKTHLANGRSSNETSLHPPSRPSTSLSSRGADVGPDESIFDFVASPVDSNPPPSHEQQTKTVAENILPAPQGPPLTRQQGADPNETSRSTTSLSNEVGNPTSENKTSDQGASDKRPSDNRETTLQEQAVITPNVSNDVERSANINAEKPDLRHAYMEDDGELPRVATPIGYQPSSREIVQSPSPRDPVSNAAVSGTSEKSPTATVSHTETYSQCQHPSEKVEPKKPESLSEVQSAPAQPYISRPDSSDEVPDGIRSSMSPESSARRNETKDSVQLASSELHSASAASISNASGQESVSTQPIHGILDVETPRPNVSEHVYTKSLMIQLKTDQTSVQRGQQFIKISLDCHVEDLFLKIQSRMQCRLDGQQIKVMKLRVSGQALEEGPYFIQRDDPDTWEAFWDMVGEIEGEKMKAVAEVEVGG